MSSAPSRLRNILDHLWPLSSSSQPSSASPPPSTPLPTTSDKAGSTYKHSHHFHTLSPTLFLPRAASIEPHAEAIVHITANGATLRRSYQEFADRARGLAYYLKTHAYKRVGVLMPNTPAFLESIYGIVAGGAVIVPVNYRLKEDDISYIFDLAEVDLIVTDWEYVSLLDAFRKVRPGVKIVVDTVRLLQYIYVCVCVWTYVFGTSQLRLTLTTFVGHGRH